MQNINLSPDVFDVMNKVYYLPGCDTCRRILKETGAAGRFELQDIKNAPISEQVLDRLASDAGSYETLFSRRAVKFRAAGLHEKTLTEADYRKLILSDYTFLKRPVFWLNEKVYAGSEAKTLQSLRSALEE